MLATLAGFFTTTLFTIRDVLFPAAGLKMPLLHGIIAGAEAGIQDNRLGAKFTMVSTRTLAKIATYGAVIVASTGVLAHWTTQDRLKKSEFHKEAMKVLRAHQPSAYLLGEPIKAGNIDFGKETNTCNAVNAQFEVPVKGPKAKGTLYFWANRENPEAKWNVYQVELELKDDASKRLLIKKDMKRDIQSE